MIRQFISRACMLLIGCCFGQAANAQYCTPTSSCDGGNIDFVNMYTPNQNVAYYSGNCSAAPEIDTAKIVYGAQVGFFVLVDAWMNTPYRCKIWADWNHDGDFSDAGETAYQSSVASTGFFGSHFTVPMNASFGPTTVRFGANQDSLGDFGPCDALPHGEYEDYHIFLAPNFCSGAPNAGYAYVASGNPLICTSGDISIGNAGTATGHDISYQWQSSTDNGGSWNDISGATSTTYSETGLSQTTSYHLVVTCHTSGQVSTGSPTTVTVKPQITGAVHITSNDADNFLITSDYIKITAENSDFTNPQYQWTVNGVPKTYSKTFTQQLDPGNTHIEVTVSGGACVDPGHDSVTIITAEPVFTLVSSVPTGQSVCAGSPVNYTVTAVGLPDNYVPEYTVLNNSGYLGVTNMPNFTLSLNENHTLLVSVKLYNLVSGYTKTYGSQPVSHDVLPVRTPVLTINAPAPICYPSTADFKARGMYLGTAPQYQWYRNGTLIAGATDTVYSVSNIKRSSDEDITVTVTNVNYACTTAGGATASTTARAVTAPDPTTNFLTASGSTKLCEGDTVTFTSKSAMLPGAIFSWARDGVTIPGATSPTYTTDQPGAITATVVSAEGCVRNSNATPRIINPLPAASISLANDPNAAGSGSTAGSALCSGSFVTLQANTNTTGATYRWKLNDVSQGTAKTQKATVAGGYVVTVTKNYCSTNSDLYTLTEKTTDVSASATAYCDLGTVRIDAASNPAYTYQWYQGTTAITGETNSSYTTTASGSYRVGISNDGCPEKKSATMAVMPATTPVASISRFSKQNAYWTLRANPGTSANTYQWYKNGAMLPGATGRDYDATVNADYTVVITKGACSSDMSAPYTVNSTTFTTASRGAAVAAGDAIISVFPNPSAGVFNIGSEQPVNVIVKDVQGRIVMDVRNAASIDLTTQAAGLYLMSISDLDGKLLQVERVVKE